MRHSLRPGPLLALTALLLTACPSSKPPLPPQNPSDVTPTNVTALSTASARGKPNVLILLSDDQLFRLFTRQYMPHTFEDLVDQGVNFTRAYTNLSLCCPSRSTVLTGLYSHDTGVDDNDTALARPGGPARPTFVQALHDAGYRTMLDGKYLNGENCLPHPGWDQWVCGAGQEAGGFDQTDPKIFVNGQLTPLKGYTTDILADYATRFMNENQDPDHPFLIYYAPKTPHLPANDTRFSSFPVPPDTTPSYNRVASDSPSWGRIPPLDPGEVAKDRGNYTKMAQQLPPLDNAMHRMLEALGSRANDTIVIYMTDNGYQYGEHRRAGKQAPYEESIRVPLVIRYPKVLPPGDHFSSDALVGNVDLAPTIMDLAGIPWRADGVSLAPILKRQATSVRTAFLIEWCEAGGPHCKLTGPGHLPSFYGVVTERYVYVDYGSLGSELYDLQNDPYELRNLSGDPSATLVKDLMSLDLVRLRAPPTTPGTTIAVAETGQGSVTFEFFSQALDTQFQCRLQGPGQDGAWRECGPGVATYASLPPGTFTFQARATDAAGHTDPTPAERRVRITG